MGIGYHIRQMIQVSLEIELLRSKRNFNDPLAESRLRQAEANLEVATQELDNAFFDDITRISSVGRGKR